MGKPTYDELTKLYKDCEIQRENLLLENEDLKDIVKEAKNYILNWKHDNVNKWMNFEDEKIEPFDLNHLLNILKGVIK